MKTTPYFLLDARLRQRQQRLRQQRREGGQRSAVSGQQDALGPLNSQLPSSQLPRFAFTAHGHDAQAHGRVQAATAEAAREKVRRNYRFAQTVTVTPLPA